MSPPTATSLVRSLLTDHPHLSTQQIWRIATEGFRPVLPVQQAYNSDGRVRMKKVSNKREGKRIWVPPPTAPMPHHPFKSTGYLKGTVLASLESHGLIHKKRMLVPHRNDEEREAAIKQAARENMRLVRDAAKAKRPPPPLKEPQTHTAQYVWVMGSPENPHSREENLGESSTGLSSRGRTDESGWKQAERMELALVRAKQMEEDMAKKRHVMRREAFLREREERKRERDEDIREGRMSEVKRLNERMKAVKAIEQYARETGEDVSGWYEELGAEPTGEGTVKIIDPNLNVNKLQRTPERTEEYF